MADLVVEFPAMSFPTLSLSLSRPFSSPPLPQIIPAGMSDYQADWLLDDEGKEIHDEDNEEEEGGDDDDDEESGEGSEEHMEQQEAAAAAFLSMPPPTGLPRRFTEAGSEFGDDGDDITLDGSILTANMPSKKELQVPPPSLPPL
jgi:hypothetical protein